MISRSSIISSQIHQENVKNMKVFNYFMSIIIIMLCKSLGNLFLKVMAPGSLKSCL